MISITVILAAVIAAMIFGTTSDLKKTGVVAVTVKPYNATYVYVVNTGGSDIKDVTNISVSGDILTNGEIGINVGSSGVFATTPGTGTKHIVVTGTFTDGKSQVLTDALINRNVP
jgi:hypothetical protein